MVMVSSSSFQEEKLVYDVKLSSVGPATVTGNNVIYEPSGMDLAMKLHYLRGVYYFRGDKSELQRLPVAKLKEPMFYLLNDYFIVNGRFRRTDSGRPYIKCNDRGVRFIEAKCSKTIDEWFESLKEDDDGSLRKMLVPNQIIGPELLFSPPVLAQFTWFKCGGFSFGLSWAHVLADLFAVTDFLHLWAKLISGLKPASLPNFPKSRDFIPRSESSEPVTRNPLALKRVDPVGDNWISPTTRKMATYSFHVSIAKIETPRFETLCALLWKKIARVRDGLRLGPGPSSNLVTVVRKGSAGRNTLTNSQVISIVDAEVNVAEADVDELAKLLVAGKVDEKSQIGKLVDFEMGLTDCIVYGCNLTFVNWENCDLYDLEVRGEKPMLVNCTIDGVGENGVVLVLPSSKEGDGGQIVIVTLPEDEVMDLKCEMKDEWFVE